MKDASTQISILLAIRYQHWYGFSALMKFQSYSGCCIGVNLCFPQGTYSHGTYCTKRWVTLLVAMHVSSGMSSAAYIV